VRWQKIINLQTRSTTANLLGRVLKDCAGLGSTRVRVGVDGEGIRLEAHRQSAVVDETGTVNTCGLGRIHLK